MSTEVFLNISGLVEDRNNELCGWWQGFIHLRIMAESTRLQWLLKLNGRISNSYAERIDGRTGYSRVKGRETDLTKLDGLEHCDLLGSQHITRMGTGVVLARSVTLVIAHTRLLVSASLLLAKDFRKFL